MTKEIQETLEGLKALMSEGKLSTCLFIAISWGEALEQAEGELGEKREKIPNDSILNDFQTIGFNEMHDIARPILAKTLLRIKELEKEVMVGKYVAEGIATVSLENFDKLQSLKEKLTVTTLRDILIEIVAQLYYEEMYPLGDNPTAEESNNRKQQAIDKYLGKNLQLGETALLHAKVDKAVYFIAQALIKELTGGKKCK